MAWFNLTNFFPVVTYNVKISKTLIMIVLITIQKRNNVSKPYDKLD